MPKAKLLDAHRIGAHQPQASSVLRDGADRADHEGSTGTPRARRQPQRHREGHSWRIGIRNSPNRQDCRIGRRHGALVDAELKDVSTSMIRRCRRKTRCRGRRRVAAAAQGFVVDAVGQQAEQDNSGVWRARQQRIDVVALVSWYSLEASTEKAGCATWGTSSSPNERTARR